MARERKIDSGGSGGGEVPDWIMTFSDMTSLLLTFFVLLFTFSTIQSEKLQKISGALRGSREIFPKDLRPNTNIVDSPLPSYTHRADDTLSPHDRAYEEATRKLEGMRMGSSRGATGLEITDTGSGKWGEFSPSASFDPNSAVPNRRLIREIEELAAVLGNFEVEIEFGGHTYSDFIPDERFPTMDAICLARARAAAEIYRREVPRQGGSRSKVQPDQIILTSYADTLPRLEFDTSRPAGRQAQRRVTIQVRKKLR